MVFSSDNGTRVLTSIMGTAGYLDPNFTGQPAIIESDDLVHIVEWVNPEFLQRDVTTILFRRILGDFSVDSVWKALKQQWHGQLPRSTAQHRATIDFLLCQLTQCLETEVSKHRERTPGSNEETGVSISPFQSSHRVISICPDSTNAGSMTAPC
ncbi:hypothetical protein PS1_026697 [Malus domestica]